MAELKKVEIKPAKGRPMLTWVGKRPLRRVTAFPAQHIETFAPNHTLAPPAGRGQGEGPTWSDWPDRYPKGGLLFHGDNKEVLAHLLAEGFRGKVNLVYIDPPFDSGADYVRKVSLRGPRGRPSWTARATPSASRFSTPTSGRTTTICSSCMSDCCC
jgi:hypothetical protein